MGVVVRRNVGYDFGSWKTGIDCYPDMGKHYSHILFANDSVYGPLVDLKPVIEKWVESDVDVWALTDSYERRDHLQSYFWGVNTRAINSGFFDYFWRRYFRYVSDRNIVIDRYELRIKAIAEGYGLKVEACFALSKMQDELEIHNIKRVNPMHDLAFALIKNYSFPFVKKELLNRNPKKLATVPELEIVISERVPELWKAIKEDRLG